ncbi:hypothetical protein D9601_05625 [Sphingomonas sp. MA1305]|nr:hypothetical protein [Sphingomonas sp. MA1305]
MRRPHALFVIPAKAGIQTRRRFGQWTKGQRIWIPACAGMTACVRVGCRDPEDGPPLPTPHPWRAGFTSSRRSRRARRHGRSLLHHHRDPLSQRPPAHRPCL